MEAIPGPLTVVHTAQQAPVLTRHRVAGKEYIYLKGVASVAAGDWVTFDEAGQTARLVPDAVGPVAIALAAVVASRWGWFQIYGVNAAATTDTVAADVQLYIDTVTGRVDDAAVTGDLIVGAVTRTADTTNVATVFLNYPYVTNVLG